MTASSLGNHSLNKGGQGLREHGNTFTSWGKAQYTLKSPLHHGFRPEKERVNLLITKMGQDPSLEPLTTQSSHS